MFEEKITCPNCGKKLDKWLVYCEFCGNVLQKELKQNQSSVINVKTNAVTNDVLLTSESQQMETIIVQKDKHEEKQKEKWYKPPHRKRPFYHPLELLFWIGWGFYLFFGFIFVVLKWLAIEFVRYLKWLVFWDYWKKKKK